MWALKFTEVIICMFVFLPLYWYTEMLILGIWNKEEESSN